jgi:hypothetical protein
MEGATARPHRGARGLLLLAGLVFALHVCEEATGFVEWMNRRLEAPMTMQEFVVNNAAALLVTLVLTGAIALGGGRGPALALVAWLSFLMLANGALHLVAAALERAYVPGALTAGLLYLPYFAVAFSACRRIGGIGLRPALAAALLGALPMLAQGAAILGAGRRLLW